MVGRAMISWLLFAQQEDSDSVFRNLDLVAHTSFAPPGALSAI